MKFTAPRSDLAAMAGWTARAIKDIRAMPILGGMLVSADIGNQGADGVQLSATNWDNVHRGRVAAHVGEPGQVLVPGLPFAQLLAGMRGPAVEITEDGLTVILRSGRSEAKLHQIALEQYPDLPPLNQVSPVAIDAEVLVDAIDVLAPLALREALHKPWESCLFMRAVEERGGIQVYCGSSYVMGRTFLPAAVTDGGLECMVPARRYADAVKPFEGELQISYQQGRVQLSASDQIASLRGFEEGYPVTSVAALFDSAVSDSFTVPTAPFREAVRLMAAGGELVSLDFREGEIVLTSSSTEAIERASVTDAVECESSGAGWRKVKLKYLLPALSAIKDETLQIDLIPQRNLMALIGDSVDFVMATITQEARAVNA